MRRPLGVAPSPDRLDVLAAMVPEGGLIVDVGADHGRLAKRIGAIATERHPRRRAGGDGVWVIADGLRPFRHVDTAIIAGMGARTIAAILAAGPPPTHVVAHADDDPALLRTLLASAGWQIEAEDLGWNGTRLAEVLRVRRGIEPHDGLVLHHGPILLSRTDLLARQHFERKLQHWRLIEHVTLVHATERAHEAGQHARFLEAHLRAEWASIPVAPDAG